MSVRAYKSGEARQRCTLWDTPESAIDSWGQPSQAATQIVNASASDGGFSFAIRPLKGDEMLNVRQLWPTATHIIKSRWLGSVIPRTPDNPNGVFAPNMKLIGVTSPLVAQGDVYNIVFADNPDKRNRQWILTCELKIGATS